MNILTIISSGCDVISAILIHMSIRVYQDVLLVQFNLV